MRNISQKSHNTTTVGNSLLWYGYITERTRPMAKTTSTKVSAKPEQSLTNYTIDLFTQTWTQIKLNPQPAQFYIGIYVLVSIVSTLIQGTSGIFNQDYIRYEDAINFFFLAALPLYGLALADRKKMTVGEFVELRPRMFAYVVLATILFSVMAVASILAFIIPAIWIIAWFTLCTYPIVDKGASPIEGLTESKRLSQNNKAKVWAASIALGLCTVAGFIFTFVPYIGNIGLAFVTILTAGVYGTLYRRLQKSVK